MNNQNTSLLTLINSDEAREISCIVRTKMDEFKTLPPGAKLKLVDSLYEQNQFFKGLGEKAIETIEDMDEEIEMKDNEIKVLKKELKSINSYDYDDKKIEEILISNPFFKIIINIVNIIIFLFFNKKYISNYCSILLYTIYFNPHIALL